MSIRPAARYHRLHWQQLGVWMLAAALAGCAGQPPLAQVGRGQRLELIVLDNTASGGETRIHNQALGQGARGGTAAGMLAGSLWSLSCGPLALLCLPATMAVAALPGAALGTVVGATGALPDAKAAALRARLARVQRSFDLTQALRSNVQQRAQQRWTPAGESAAWVLTLDIRPLELSSTRDEQIGLMVRVNASLRQAGASAEATFKTFEYTSPPSTLSVLLDERSDFLETIFGSCAQQLATQIVSEVARQ